MITYYINPDQKLMLRFTGPMHAYLLQVKGRDLDGVFCHRHESVTYPSEERLQKEIEILQLQPATAEAWEELMNEFLQVNNAKRELMNQYRQRMYEKGLLKL